MASDLSSILDKQIKYGNFVFEVFPRDREQNFVGHKRAWGPCHRAMAPIELNACADERWREPLGIMV